MRIKLLLSALFILTCKISTAQWAGGQTTPWVYSFSSGTAGTLDAPTTAVSAVSPTFLPTPTSGLARAYIAANTGGSFTIDPTANTLTMVPVSGAGTSKHSAYNITPASPIATHSVTINFGRSGTNIPVTGLVYSYLLGNKGASDNVFSNPSSGFNATAGANSLMTLIRFTSTATPTYTVSFRKSSIMTNATSGNTTTYTNLTGGSLVENVNYNIETYTNNSIASKNYTKNANVYTVAAGSYHLWITDMTTGVAVRYYFTQSLVDIYDIPKTIETSFGGTTGDLSLPADAVINSYALLSTGNTTNYGKLTISGNATLTYDLTTLPVSLTSFKGDLQNNEIALTWQTISENNNSHFEILRSSDVNKTPVIIGRVNGKGNSSSTVNYNFSDNSPLIGNNYYQLRQLDFNGKASLSKIIAIKSNLGSNDVVVYKGESNSLFASINSNENADASFTLIDIQGKVINQFNDRLNSGNNIVQLYKNALLPGIYVIKMNINGTQVLKKINY